MPYPLTDLPLGDMQLYDNTLPGLPAGSYEIDVTQALPNAVTDNFSQTITQAFVVNAPQFTLEPSEVHSVFPADRSNGDFSVNLPYVVFETPVLPWERLIDQGQPNTIPWMALIVLSADEVQPDAATGSPLINGSVADFLKIEPKIVKPAIAPSSVSAETLQSRMNSIVLPVSTFMLVCPRLQELTCLAHLREVNPASQVISGKSTDAWYAELIANRFPVSVNPTDSSGMKNYLFVVSFEGLSNYLTAAPVWPLDVEYVQLAVLYASSFISAKQPGQTFDELAVAMSSQATSAGGTGTLLRIPITGNGTTAAQRILDGYTALSYHTQPGDKTFTWYRGPLAPYPAQPLPQLSGNILDPSQVLIYDQANAIFDTSYSAAWTIGRLMALANPVFTDNVQRVRKRMITQNAKLLQRSLMPHLAGITDLAVLASNGITRKVFANHIGTGMGDRLQALFEETAGPAVAERRSPPVNHLFPDEVLPASHAERIKWFMQHPSIGRFLVQDSAEDMGPLSDWLAQLVLLKNVPFTHLVPDQRMLPQESIRFFVVDGNWLKALYDGAISIGVHTSQQQMVHSLIAPVVWEKTVEKASLMRYQLLKKVTRQDLPVPVVRMPVAGMLLRSALVSGWPGLQVAATAGGNTVNCMRMERLSPTVLIVLWDAVPDTVTVSQPQQGFAYGTAASQLIPLRSLNAANLGATTGTNFPSTGTIVQFMRLGNNGQSSNVLNLVPATQNPPQTGYLIPALAGALGVGNALTPSQLAIELIQSPAQIIFNPTGH